MILDNINFKGYDIKVDNMDLKWKSPQATEFHPDNLLRCKSEITSLFPLMDRLFITTLNGCLYRILFPSMGPLYLEERMIMKSIRLEE